MGTAPVVKQHIPAVVGFSADSFSPPSDVPDLLDMSGGLLSAMVMLNLSRS